MSERRRAENERGREKKLTFTMQTSIYPLAFAVATADARSAATAVRR